jgi:DNA replication protein DnaD
MRLVTDRPTALSGSFVLMGIIEDGLNKYACVFDTSNGKMYFEEMYWTTNVKGNEATAHLREIGDDKEWAIVNGFVTKSTTILSPKKLRLALATAKHRGVKQIDAVLNAENFPYAKRKIDPATSYDLSKVKMLG